MRAAWSRGPAIAASSTLTNGKTDAPSKCPNRVRHRSLWQNVSLTERFGQLNLRVV
jgi:hypothetical protein